MTTQDKIKSLESALDDALSAIHHLCEAMTHDKIVRTKVAEAHVEKARRLMEGER